MQDTKKTLEIYEEALYPAMQDWDITELVEDNASPHNNDAIRSSHRRHGVNIVGYNATERQKEIIRTLIEEQTRQYRVPQAAGP